MARDLLAALPVLRRLAWRAMRLVARDLAANGGRLLAHALGDLAWWCDAQGRRMSERNLRLVMPSSTARRRVTRAAYRACAEQLAFTLRLDRHRTVELGQLTISDPWQVLPLAGPAIMATVHADWDALLSVTAGQGLMLNTAGIALTSQDPWIDQLLGELRAAQNVQLFSGAGAARAALVHLSHHGVVALVADRDYAGDGFRIRTSTGAWKIPRGPLALARKTESSLVPMACVRSRGRALVVIGRPLWPHLIGMQEAARALARFQVQVLSAAPSRWVAFHDQRELHQRPQR